MENWSNLPYTVGNVIYRKSAIMLLLELLEGTYIINKNFVKTKDTATKINTYL